MQFSFRFGLDLLRANVIFIRRDLNVIFAGLVLSSVELNIFLEIAVSFRNRESLN